MALKMKIKKGDLVQIISGKDRGKRGKILRVFPDDGKIVVEGLNLLYKNVRPKRENEKGQRIQFPGKLNAAKIMLVCPKCSKAIKVGYKILADGKKNRFCRKCNELI